MLEIQVALEQSALARQDECRGDVGGDAVAGPDGDVPHLEGAASEDLNEELLGRIDVRHAQLRDRDDQYALVEDPVAREVGLQRQRRRALVGAQVDRHAAGPVAPVRARANSSRKARRSLLLLGAGARRSGSPGAR